MTKQSRKPNSQSSGHIRIIAGKHRSRKLPVKDLPGLRPTTDRVKETVFNWLMQKTHNAVVLDCFAGSGGLGFEALSRYASSVTFIELDKSAAAQIKQNLVTLKEEATVINGSALDNIPKLTQSYNLVFIDPPFRKDLAQPCCELLDKHNLIAKDGLIYLEVESEIAQLNLPTQWQLLKEKVAGQVKYQLYQNCIA